MKIKENCDLESCQWSESLKWRIILSSKTTCTRLEQLLGVPNKESYAHFIKETYLGTHVIYSTYSQHGNDQINLADKISATSANLIKKPNLILTVRWAETSDFIWWFSTSYFCKNK